VEDAAALAVGVASFLVWYPLAAPLLADAMGGTWYAFPVPWGHLAAWGILVAFLLTAIEGLITAWEESCGE
jgi:hypothetical protein